MEPEPEFRRSRSSDNDRVHASYGKACLSCVKSKTRCAASSSGGRCERCLRLDKDCQPAPTVRKRKSSKRPTSSLASVANKTATLERKLDGIVQLLHNSQTTQSQSNSPTSTQGVNQARDPLQHDGSNQGCTRFGDLDVMSSAAPNRNLAIHSVSQEPLTPATSVTLEGPMCSTIPNNSTSLSSNKYPVESESECDECLETYRKMVSFCPIVVIGPEVTVNQLREQRPFLWLVIRAISSKNSARQRALGIELRKELGRQILVEGARSLDLLLGVLVFAAWGHYYISHRPIITADIQLGISLACDLGLTKPVPAEPVGVMMNYSAQGCPKPPVCHLSPPRTMEERRAIVGLFFVTSVAANYFQRIDPMRWTPYMDECLRLLEERKDSPTDELLVFLVRVQLISNKVATVVWTDNSPAREPDCRLSQDLYRQVFTSQLEELKSTIPPSLQSNATLQLHILNATISIHEHSLIVPPLREASFDPAAKIQLIENLWTCFTATKTFFATYFSLDLFPLSCYPQLSMAIFTQLAHCMVVLFRVSTFESPGIAWDRQRVRQELDLGDVLKLWIERWEGVPAAAGLDSRLMDENEEGPWAFTRKTLLVIRKWWEIKLEAMMATEAQRGGGQPLDMHANVNGFEESRQAEQHQMEAMDFAAVHMDGVDDMWVRDMLGGGFDFFREPYF